MTKMIHNNTKGTKDPSKKRHIALANKAQWPNKRKLKPRRLGSNTS